MRTPQLIDLLKNSIIKSIIIRINKLAGKIGPEIKIPGDQLSLKGDMILKADLKSFKGWPLQMEFPATVEDNGFDAVVIGIPNDLTTRQATCECIECETDSFKSSPS